MAFTSVIKGLHTNSLYGLNLFLSRWAWKAWTGSDWWSRSWERSRGVSAETADLLKTGGPSVAQSRGGGGRDSVTAVTFQQTNLDHHGLPFAALSAAESAAPQSLPTRADLTFESQLPLSGHKTVKCQTVAGEQRLEMRRTVVSVGCLPELYSS